MTESVLYKIVRARIAGISRSCVSKLTQRQVAGDAKDAERLRVKVVERFIERTNKPEAMARRYQTPRGERFGVRSEADALENEDDAPARAIAHRSSSGNSRGSLPSPFPPSWITRAIPYET